MKKSEDKRFICLIAGMIMMAVLIVFFKTAVWIWENGGWPAVIVYIGLALCLMVLSADMTPMDEENDL